MIVIIQILVFLVALFIPQSSYALSENTTIIGAATGGIVGATAGYFIADAITSPAKPEKAQLFEKLKTETLQEIDSLTPEDLSNSNKIQNIILKISLVLLGGALGSFVTYAILHGYTTEGMARAARADLQHMQHLNAEIAARDADPMYHARELHRMEEQIRNRHNAATVSRLVSTGRMLLQAAQNSQR